MPEESALYDVTPLKYLWIIVGTSCVVYQSFITKLGTLVLHKQRTLSSN